jgi:hypothetical protein
MAGPNTDPIYSRLADIDGANNATIFVADPTNGGFVQRLRFKALGTNAATVARIYVTNNSLRAATTLAAVSGTPTGTPSGTGGTLATGAYFAKVYATDQWGGFTVASTETASISVTGPTGSIAFAWTAVTGAVSYTILVGPATGQQVVAFTSTTNSYTMTAPGTPGVETDFVNNNYFYGEVSLPATTAIATSSTIDIDYPMGFALAPGQSITLGLGTAVAAGWVVTTIAGRY